MMALEMGSYLVLSIFKGKDWRRCKQILKKAVCSTLNFMFQTPKKPNCNHISFSQKPLCMVCAILRNTLLGQGGGGKTANKKNWQHKYRSTLLIEKKIIDNCIMRQLAFSAHHLVRFQW